MSALPTLAETIKSLTEDTVARRQTLEGALFGLQAWIDRRAEFMTETERSEFSQILNEEKAAPEQDGKARGDDSSLIASVLRLHAMRLLYRFDDLRERQPPLPAQNDTPYSRATHRLQMALREVELAINEARVDTMIANAQNILNDKGANRRWLQDALTRLQTVAQKDLIRLAESVPSPDLPPLNILQRVAFRLAGISQQEIARRNLQSIRHLAELQTAQLVEMVRLLADSFSAIDDPLGTRQALSLLVQLGGDTNGKG